MTQVVDLLLRHTSCRDYVDERISDATLQDLVRAAQQSSTDATGQLYSVLRLKDPVIRNDVARLSGDQPHLHAASEFLIVLLDTFRVKRLLESRGEQYGMRPLVALLFGITDATIFAQSLVVAAESYGYGICYIGGVQNNSREIAKRLRLPEGVVPLYGLTLGRPKQPSRPKPRLPIDHVLHVDHYHEPTDEDLRLAYELMARATRSGDWVNPIRKYFATDGVMEQREEEFYGLLEDQGLTPTKPGFDENRPPNL